MENKLNKISSFIKKPPKWFQISWIILTTLLLITSILVSIFLSINVLNCVIYGLTFVFFIYSTYLFFKHYKKYLNQLLVSKLESNKHYIQFKNSSLYKHYDKKLFYYVLSTCFGIIYVLVLIILGIVYHSQYYGIFSAYYLLSISIKLLVIIAIFKFKDNIKKQQLIKLISSILLLILNIIVCIFVTYIIFVPNKFQYDNWIVITLGVYITFRIIATIVSLTKWKTKESLKTLLKKISVIELLVTTIVLQTTMIAYYGATNTMSILNYIIGFVVCFSIVMLIGQIIISSIIQYIRFNKNKKYQLENN